MSDVRIDSPGFRLLRVLQRVADTQGGDPFEAWALILEIKAADGGDRDRAIMTRLGHLQDQLARLTEDLRTLPNQIDESSYAPSLARVRSALSFQRLREPWSSIHQHAGAETLGILRILTQFLPVDQDRIEADELDELRQQVVALMEQVGGSDSLSAKAQAFLLRQLEIILRAIGDYPYCGSKAFQDASLSAHVAWASQPDVAAEVRDTPEVQGVRDIWARIVTYGKRLVLLHVFIAGVIQTTDAALGIIEKRHLLPSATDIRDVFQSIPLLEAPERAADAKPPH